MPWRRVVAGVGSVIFAFGLLILLFVAYQLWGTSLTTRLHQESLRAQFNQELAVTRAQDAARAAVSTTTTPPTNGVAPLTPGVAPAEGQPIGTLDIPDIGANFVVVQGTGTADLQLGPGHYESTPLPGQPGNAAIAGHRTTYLHPFSSLDKLSAGDPIYVTTTQGRFRYDVTSTQIVDPSDLAVLDPTPVPTLTLTTCNPRYSASQRLVVQATLVSPPARVPVAPAAEAEASGHRPGRAASGLGGASGSAWPVVGWGAATLGFVAGVWLVARRRSRRLVRLGIAAAGTVGLLVLLFLFFESVTPLLPASF